MMSKISQQLTRAKKNEGNAHFGGINVVLCGDHHQIGPIGDRPLYMPKGNTKHTNSPEAHLGYQIYREFTTAVELVQQVRITDAIWQDLLSRMRYGICSDNDIKQIETLVIRVRSTSCCLFTSSFLISAIGY